VYVARSSRLRKNRGLTPISQRKPLILRERSCEMGCLTSVFPQPASLVARSTCKRESLVLSRFRLEADLQSRSSRCRQAFERLSGGFGTPAFQPRDHRLSGIHFSSELLLREAGVNARFDHRTGESKLGGQLLVRFPILWVLHPLPVKVLYFAHCSNSSAL